MKSTILRSILVAGCLTAFATFNFVSAQTDVSTAAELQAAIDNGDSAIVLTAPISVTTPINIGTTSSPTLTINGNGNAITGSTEIFFIQSGNVTISNTTLTGAATGGSGSTAEAAGGGALGPGGAIFVGATASVTASSVQFSNNSATGGDGGTGTINGTVSGGGGMNGGTGTAAGDGGAGGGGGNGGAGGSGSVGAGGGGGGLNSAGATGYFQNGGAGGGPNGGSGGGGSSAGDGGVNSGGGGGNFVYGNNGGNGGTNGGGGGAGDGGNGGNGGSYGGGGAAALGSGGNGGFGGGGGGGYTGGGAGGFGAGGGGNLNGAGGTGGVGAGNGAPGTGGSSGGGGGAGLGGAVFEQAGGEFIITGNETFSGNSVTGGTGANNGAAAGSDIFVMTGAGIIIAPGPNNTITVNGTIADDSASSLPGGSYTTGTATGVGIQFGRNTSVSGTVVLNGANTFSGGGTITNATVVEAGNATALGTGPITNTTGVLTVTLSNHSIVLKGYTQDSQGSLGLYVNGLGANAVPDQLHITNTSAAQATLGGSLVVNFSGFTATAGGGPARTLDLTVVRTDAGYTGTFTSLDSLGLTGAAASVLYAGNDVDIQLALPASVFSMAGLDSNERGVLSTINSGLLSGSSSPGLNTLSTALDRLPTTEMAGALDELSPTKFASFATTTAINNETFATQDMDIYLQSLRDDETGGFASGKGQLDSSGLVINDPNVDPGLQMIHSRMLAWEDPVSTMTDVPGSVLGGVDMKEMKPSCAACTAASSPWDVFLRGNVVLAQGFSQADVPHFDDNTESVVVGADYHFTPHLLAGVTASYAHTDATLDDFGSSATVDSYSPGIYASWADGGGYANFLGRYSFNSYTESRDISLLGQTASGATDGNEGVVDLDGGYAFHDGALTYGPVAGVQYTHLTVNSYAEQNSYADLSVKEDQADSLRSRLGGSVRYNFKDGGMIFTPHLEATWQHEFLTQDRGLTSQFSDFSGGSFTVRTPNVSADSALVDFGLDAQLNKSITVFGDYLVQAGQNNYFGQSVQAGVRVNF